MDAAKIHSLSEPRSTQVEAPAPIASDLGGGRRSLISIARFPAASPSPIRLVELQRLATSM